MAGHPKNDPLMSSTVVLRERILVQVRPNPICPPKYYIVMCTRARVPTSPPRLGHDSLKTLSP
eukprot:scaffold11172_cov172-Amphora_coffeaeformis.AAC.10